MAASGKKTDGRKDIRDVIIVGAGCSGLAAAVYCGRFLMRTLVLGETIGGVIITTDVVENYPGFIRLTGTELAKKLEEHARDYKSVEIREEKVIEVVKNGNIFKAVSEEGAYYGRAVIISSGTEHKKLDVPGESELANRGVHYCALCDGALYQDRPVAVVGGSDSAAKEALVLSQWASRVYMIYRGDKIRPEPVNYERVIANRKIEIISQANVMKMNANEKGFLKSVTLDKPYKGMKEFPVDAAFVAIGHIPLTGFARGLGLKTNDKGEILIDRNAHTNVPGVFAAGDVVDTSFKQAITGAAEGVLAAYSAYQHVSDSRVL
ncbi:FAD-dependent oxidoreductase [Candidatus Woesearchaeota archaeon]|nr:FAD-dependent oxidoreductase [Candidatus Woesearchaeota archaeon]